MSSEAALIVERVKPGSHAERAGIRPEDRLLTYEGQWLLSPSLLKALEDNTFGVERVTLLREREGQRTEVAVPPGSLGMETRPEMSPAALSLHVCGWDALRAEQYAEAVRFWSDAAQNAQDAQNRMVAAWLFIKAGKAWEQAENWQAAQSYHATAYELLADIQRTASQAKALSALQVTALSALGGCLFYSNKLEAATERYVQAQRIAEQHGWPGWVANALHVQGMVAFYCGELTPAQEFFARAAALREPLMPGSQEMTAGFVESLNGQGLTAWKRGDLAYSQESFTRALRAQESIAPDTHEVASILNNLGLVACDRGDLDLAEDCHLRALRIREQPSADLPAMTARFYVAMSVGNLGAVAWERGDLAQSQNRYKRAAIISKKLDLRQPGFASLRVDCRISLGNIACRQNALKCAERCYSVALAILARTAPDSLEVAVCLSGLANVEWKRGHKEREQGRGEQAALHYARAHDHCDRALAIFESLAPVSLNHAGALMDRGQAALRQGRWEQAVPHLQQAISIVEQQRSRIIAPEARALLVAQHTAKYAALIQAYVALDDREAAFLTLESARARSFVELLAERELDFADAPAELLAARNEVDIKLAYARKQLSERPALPANAAQANHLRRAIRDLEREQSEFTARIRAASPHFAALQYPQPLPLKAAQDLLAPGMLLLSYFVEEEQTFLFAAIKRDAKKSATEEDTIKKSVAVFTLPLGRAALQEKTRQFQDALNPRLLMSHNGERALALGRELYAALILPAQALLGGIKRVLLCPDGPLHTLPFGALVTNSGGPPCYMGIETPLHNALSMTLYAQAMQQKPIPVTKRARRAFALGNPRYAPAPPGGKPEFERLQYSQEEVEFLAQLFGRYADTRMDAQATKTAVLKDSGAADIVHLACHAWFDARTPLSSGLALSDPKMLGRQAPPDDNGRLEAWEIMQNLRLQAELVVLSACWTGIGHEVRGEGLIGLARAFQYAGANSLVVTLWAVNDACTSLFMQEFYKTLLAGYTKDEALLRGAKALQKRPEWNHPYYWSAFILLGDRKNVAGPDEILVRQSQLARQAQQQKCRPFDTLDKQHRPGIKRYCERLLHDKASADEAAQEVFICAWKKINGFRLEAPFPTWLRSIATSICQERNKKAGDLRHRTVTPYEPERQDFSDMLSSEQTIDALRSETNVEEEAINSIYVERLLEIVARLSQTSSKPWNVLDAEIFSLFYEKDMNSFEIAEALNVKADLVRYRKKHRILPVVEAALKEITTMEKQDGGKERK